MAASANANDWPREIFEIWSWMDTYYFVRQEDLRPEERPLLVGSLVAQDVLTDYAESLACDPFMLQEMLEAFMLDCSAPVGPAIWPPQEAILAALMEAVDEELVVAWKEKPDWLPKRLEPRVDPGISSPQPGSGPLGVVAAMTMGAAPKIKQLEGDLPILLARYAVVPKDVQPGLPDWAGAARVRDIALGADFQYALRTLRQGYVYLFYSMSSRGSDIWECYAVDADGNLNRRPVPSIWAPGGSQAFSSAEPQTQVTGSTTSYIVIEKPRECGPTWIAFTATQWSEETLQQYATNAKLRDARMQMLQPAAMATGVEHLHGAVAEASVLQNIMEYSDAFSQDRLPFDPVAEELSQEDGSYLASRLQKMSTRYPWHSRKGQTDSTLEQMDASAVGPGGNSVPHVLALWDAIGIVHELNGFRNDAAGWLKKYGEERELQVTALNAIESTKSALEKRAEAKAREVVDQPMVWTAEDSAVRLDSVAKLRPERLQNEQRLVRLWEQDAARRIPRTLSESRVGYVDEGPAAFEEGMEVVDGRIAKLAQEREDGQTAYTETAVSSAWAKYDDRLDKLSMIYFKKHWDALLEEAARIIDRRTEALVQWLEASLFLDTLEDFNQGNIEDGVRFEDVVGDAVFGMGSSPAGQKKIDEWIKEAKASVRGNLLWRAVALNQREGIVDVDAVLRVAYGKQEVLSMSTWDNYGAQVKWNKLADLTKKSLTLFNTQMKAANDSKAGIQALSATHGLDRVFMTVGGRWFAPFNWIVDTVNEAMLQSLLLVRCGAKPEAIRALAAWQAVNGAAERAELLRRLADQRAVAVEAQVEELGRKWAALRDSADVSDARRGSFNAARDARLALIVAIFEAFNLYKASAKAAQAPNNEKAQAQLTAAKYATTSAAIDVLSNMVKGLAAAGDRSVSYQALKFGGGALSIVASGYGAALDWDEKEKMQKLGDYRMAILFGIRSWFQRVSAVLTGLTTLSYCSPLVLTFGAKLRHRLTEKALTWVGEKLLLERAALALASIEVSIFLLLVTNVIWAFEDDALEKWLDRCAFGLMRDELPERYSDADAQMKAYFDALVEVW